MRRIVPYISLAMLLVVGCSVESSQPISGHVTIAYLQSLAKDRSQPIESDIYVEGYVVAGDHMFRELEYAVVIDDGTAGVELKIDCHNIGEQIPLFSYVRLNCSGLSIGREGPRLVLGAVPTGEYVVDRISESEIFNYLSSPDLFRDAPEPRDLAIHELSSGLVLSYAQFNNLRVVDDDRGKEWCDVSLENPNERVTTLRYFTDGIDTLAVMTSANCLYGSDPIPDKALSLVGIVEWREGDYALRVSGHQIFEER